MKCLFEGPPASTGAEIYIGCKKHSSKCVSQEFDIPDEPSTPLEDIEKTGPDKSE